MESDPSWSVSGVQVMAAMAAASAVLASGRPPYAAVHGADDDLGVIVRVDGDALYGAADLVVLGTTTPLARRGPVPGSASRVP